MASKLGLHINFATETEAMTAFVRRTKPAVVKVLNLGDTEFPRRVREASPETLIIGRKFVSSQPLDNPEGAAENMAGRILGSSCARERVVEIFEGYNEINTYAGDRIKRLSRFDKRLAQIMHENEFQYIAGSYAVGHPDPNFIDYEEVLEAFREADYIGIHEYFAPSLDDPRNFDEAGNGWWLLRYRLWWPRLPAECQKPILITECGIDSGAPHFDPGAQGGWRSFMDADDYVEQLRWYDRHLQEDDYVIGATIFCWGTLDPTWSTFDLSGDAARNLEAYLVSELGVPPEEPVEPVELDEVERLRALLREIRDIADRGLG